MTNPGTIERDLKLVFGSILVQGFQGTGEKIKLFSLFLAENN